MKEGNLCCWSGAWIWAADALSSRNAFVRFRRVFAYSSGPADLHITADSRYVLHVNGKYVGQGPVRCWPNHWRYDSYDLTPHLKQGDNVIAVVVNHYGESNFQYLHGPAGLLANLIVNGQTLATDSSWRAAKAPAFTSITPRISVQESFVEEFDARKDDGWIALEYDDSAWAPATELRPADDGEHKNLAPKAIPHLTREPIVPQRVVSAEIVNSQPYQFTIYAKPYLAPTDLTSNMVRFQAYLATQVWSPCEGELHLVSSVCVHEPPKLNGTPMEGNRGALKAGWNNLVANIGGLWHLPEHALCFDGPEGLKFRCTGEDNAASWAIAGPFALTPEEYADAHERHMDASLIIVNPTDDAASYAAGEAFWASGDVATATGQPWFTPVAPDHLPVDNVFLQAYTDKVADETPEIDSFDGLLSANDWTTIQPSESGDVRILLDYGREVTAHQQLEIVAPAGTIVDFHNFEFIQPDGRYNFAEGMCNAFRYICREGYQVYTTWQRRGFQYSYVILRGMTGPVKLRRVEALFASYPQTHRGRFASSDAQLDRIWQVGAHTLRCCAEDTYVDCPTYEQTNWVGDARNEALVDWTVNGDPRLWFRCLEQTGDSLDRSPITESNVPSGWENILPAWSFLWMRSCREYFLFSGDRDGAACLLGYIERNVNGVRQHLNAQGLFEIRAWNMFDWAEMDTPPVGVVTHQNCFAVLALNEAAEMAQWLEQADLAADWRKLAASISDAINEHLWNDEKQAYTDCLRDGKHSPVFSQQTATVAHKSGVAQGERATRCRDIIYNPPEGFVRAGSPFFEFFLLEAYQGESRVQEFLDTIRHDWGFMVDMGASTFWEMWSGREGRLTRSHCHAWSAAPTYFLTTYVLGITPGGPGFSPVVIEPHPGDLAWCRGVMPTPAGDVEVQWENPADGPFVLRVNAPENADLDIRLPREGHLTVNGQEA